MDEAFKNIAERGKNNVEDLVQWMKHAKIVKDEASEEEAKQLLGKGDGNITLERFKESLSAFAKKHNATVDEYARRLCVTGDAIEGVFNKLKAEGKNNVDSVLQWMKDASIIVAETEDIARKMLSDAKNEADLELNKVKDTIQKLSIGANACSSGILQTITDQGNRLMDAACTAFSSFMDQ